VVNGGQTGEETVGCLPVEGDTRALAWSERSALGFSADEVLRTLGSSQEVRLTYQDGSTTTLQMEIERRDDGVEFQNREWQDDGSGRELAMSGECNDAVVIPVTLSFSTNDGAFDESWPLELAVETATEATVFSVVNLDTLEGDFALDEAETSGLVNVQAFISLALTGDDWSGDLSGQGTRSSGSGPNSSASSQAIPIATF
jgi:hypothetical protein